MTAQQLQPHQYDRIEALRRLQAVYQALASVTGASGCGGGAECCQASTPIVSNTEAEYVRERMISVPYPRYQAILAACRAWLLDDNDGPRSRRVFGQESQNPVGVRRHIEHLKRQPCPFLQRQDGGCLLAGLEPLHCRVEGLPEMLLEPVYAVMRGVFEVYPQRVGFLPAQLFALFCPDEFTGYVADGRIADAKTAMGDLAPLIRELEAAR